MSVFQAALIALFYAFARSSFSAGLGEYVFSQPLVAGTLVGLLLGDPLAGAALGGVLNLASLALSNVKVRFGPDIALASYVGIPIMLLNGITAGSPEALVIFAAIAVSGILLNYMSGMFNTLLAHWADFFAEKGEVTVVAFITIMPSQLWLFVIAFIPAFVMLRFDARALVDVAAAIPPWLQSALFMSQALLAALGIAISLRAVMHGSSAAYFILGWLGAQLFGLVPVTLLGASIATIHAFVARKRMEPSQETLIADALPSAQTDAPGPDDRLTLRLDGVDLRASFLLWVFFHNAALNFERVQNMGLATAMAPITRKLHRDVAERAACLRRHLPLFSTEFSFGAMLVGASAALEECRANGDAISEAEFVGAKSGLMAGLGVVGEALVVGVITTFGVAVGSALAQQQNLLGPFLFAVFEATAVLSIAYLSFHFGYSETRRAMGWARSNDWLRAGLFGAVRLGTFMLGALVISLVPLRLPPDAVIQFGQARIELQTVLFDRIMPYLFPLIVVLAMWWLLRFRNVSPMVLLGAVIVISFVASGLLRVVGWL